MAACCTDFAQGPDLGTKNFTSFDEGFFEADFKSAQPSTLASIRNIFQMLCAGCFFLVCFFIFFW